MTASSLTCSCRLVAVGTTPDPWRKVAAGSASFPPLDRSGAVPPVGHSQFPRWLPPGQLPGSHRWHPCCRRCLLKGCERWFLPRHPQARYCSLDCRKAAGRWRVWLACQRYRATPNGRQHRRDQAQRYRVRVHQRCPLSQPEPTPAQIEAAPPVAELLVQPTPDPPTPPCADCVGQRPAEISQDSSGSPCHRPGCYVLFLPAVRSLEQRFCCRLCRQALRRVRQREARLRLRRRRGIRPPSLAGRRRSPPAAFMSSHS